MFRFKSYQITCDVTYGRFLKELCLDLLNKLKLEPKYDYTIIEADDAMDEDLEEETRRGHVE
jgi:hypothetical protein